jgi:peptide/nickel transport system ATP-binding protein
VSGVLGLQNVSKTFRSGGPWGEAVRAVDDVSLSLPDSPTILSLVGESGSGKTTLARLILGLLHPTSGHISVGEHDVSKLRGRRAQRAFMRHVQPIFQNPYDTFNPVRPVTDALFETARNLTGASRGEAVTLVAEALETVGLSLGEVAGKYQGSFSGGQLQRLSVARALIPKPKLIVADEPVSALDASLRMTVVNLFAKLKDTLGISFVYVTHDLSTAYYISDTVAIMHNGRIVESGPASDVLTNPEDAYTRRLVAAIPQVGVRWDWNEL